MMNTTKRHIKSISKGFIFGLSELLDLHYYDISLNHKTLNDDFKALQSDWKNISEDLSKSVVKFEKLEKENLKDLVE